MNVRIALTLLANRNTDSSLAEKTSHRGSSGLSNAFFNSESEGSSHLAKHSLCYNDSIALVLNLCSNVRLEEYIFVDIHLIGLILKKVRKKEKNRLLKVIY